MSCTRDLAPYEALNMQWMDTVNWLEQIRTFTNGPVFPTLRRSERRRLIRQEQILDMLADVLAERREHFTPGSPA